MLSIFSNVVECFLEVVIDDYLVFVIYLINVCIIYCYSIQTYKEEFGLELGAMSFYLKKCIILGHIISIEGIEVNKANVDLIFNLPSSKTIRELRSFLGHASFYRCFIKNFSKIS